MTSKDRIYLDYHATTPVDPRVARVVMHYMTEEFGNANSSDHVFGDTAEAGVESARESLAALVGVATSQVVFTSGATESIWLALRGFVRSLRAQGLVRAVRLALPSIEHRAVLDTCQALERTGEVDIRLIQVDSSGRVDLAEIREVCESGQDLVCFMAANNEIGNVYPISQIAEIVTNSGAFFFTDATQAVGKVPVRFNEWNIDALALSAHKFYGPKGVGALILSKRFPLHMPLSHNAKHRPGTPNVPGIVGLGEAAKLRLAEMMTDEPRVGKLRDTLYDLISASIPNVVMNGDKENRLAGNLHISIPGIPNQTIISRLREHVAVSTGSACSSGIESPSHVLRAMGLPSERLDSALRFGLGKFNSLQEVHEAANWIERAVYEVNRILA